MRSLFCLLLLLATAALAEPAGTGRALLHLYPQADPQADWVVTRNADGTETIARWNAAKLGAKPTDAQLTQARADYAAARAAETQALTTERKALQSILEKINAAQTLTAAEQGQLFRILIRRARE